MIFITGDTHSSFNRFTRKNFSEQDDMTKEDYVIIAGDFGSIWYPVQDTSHRKAEDYNLDELDKRNFTTLFIPGNHENYTRLMGDEFPTVSWKGGVAKLIRPSILMLMRGEMYDIDGTHVFAFGGARSHDIQDGLLDVEDPDWKRKARQLRHQGKRYYRVKGMSWWEEELPTAREMRHGLDTLKASGWAADYVITHCAPTSVQRRLGRDDADVLTDYLEAIHQHLQYRKWFFGHYHANREIDDRHVLLYEQISQLDPIEAR